MALIPWRNKQRDAERGEHSPLASLRGEMDRLFESLVREPIANWDWPFAGRPWSPAVDVAENDRELTVRAEIPGMKPEDVEVTVSGSQLILSGEKKEVQEEKGQGFYQTESRYGSFRRAIPLPEAVDPAQVEAEYSHGVLTVRLKKSAAAAPKRIEVKAK